MATILIIDDDVQILWVMRKMLEQAGHTVMSASDGEKGFKLYHDSPTDLVITDMIMPGKSGMNIVADLLHDQPDAKIIAISGGGAIEAERYLNLARTLGAQATLSKPFSMQALLDTVQNVLARPARTVDL
ncbi:MAG: response regulator [Thermodesulfobacteriota bacterium]